MCQVRMGWHSRCRIIAAHIKSNEQLQQHVKESSDLHQTFSEEAAEKNVEREQFI